jgi:hypothetical protein
MKALTQIRGHRPRPSRRSPFARPVSAKRDQDEMGGRRRVGEAIAPARGRLGIAHRVGRQPGHRSARSSTAPSTTPTARRGLAPGPHPLTGICGSDLSLIEGHASTYFDDWVSFPFVPGHEVVGRLDDGTRVVLEPVLGHEARGFRPRSRARHQATATTTPTSPPRHLEPGIQTGFCCSTGGGWAPWFVAHESQLHRISDDVPDERAVLVEPIAGGIHAALLTWPTIERTVADGQRPVVAVLGAGTMGLAAIAGLRRYVPDVAHHRRCPLPPPAGVRQGARRRRSRRTRRAAPGRPPEAGVPRGRRPPQLRRARHDRRRRHEASRSRLPAHHPPPRPGRAARHARRRHARPHRPVAPRDRAQGCLHLRHRDRRLPDGTRARTFDLAFDTAAAIGAERLLSATYRLADHVDAVAHAASAGRRGAVKIAFDLREDRSHAPSRIRPRRRPLDPAHAVLARRELQPRAAAGRSQPHHLPARAARAASTTSTARSATRC